MCAVVGLAVGAVALVGCDATPSPSVGGVGTPSAPHPAVAPAPLSWTPVTLPDGVEPLTLTGIGLAPSAPAAPPGAGALVGGYAATRPHPRLFVAAEGVLREVPVAPTSPYAVEARWLSVADRAGDVVAVAGARGGAHANVRWTVWRGTRGRLVEQPQPFGVFGGWGAGDLTGVAFRGPEPVVVGAWAGEMAGNDVSLWHVTGARWSRASSRGTPFGSTPTALAGARSVTSWGQGLVVNGALTELGGGAVRTVPVVWTAGPTGAWTTVRLPSSSPLAEAHAARCEGAACLVVGRDGDHLAAWRVGSGSVAAVRVPPIAVGDHDQLVAPVSVGGHVALVVPGAVLVATTGAAAAQPSWRAVTGPVGRPVAAAPVGVALWVAAADADGATHLWSATP